MRRRNAAAASQYPTYADLNNMGIKTTLLCAGGLLLAAGGPLGYFSAPDVLSNVKKNWLSDSTSDRDASGQGDYSLDADPPTHDAAGNPTAVTAPNGRQTPPTPSLDEALRFDVTVGWITQRWPRVSTGLSHLQLHGYRVPLVTGTELGDVAGSLTYYFDPRQQVQRITLRGSTGDPRPLIALTASRFRLVRRLTNNPGIALYEAVDAGNHPTGKLTIRSADVITADKPYSRYEVDLVVDRAE